jgi:MFS family permease
MEWYQSLDGRQKRSFWACFGGWTLDAMDVQIYALVLPTLIASWGLSKGEAGLLGTAGLLASSIGGIIAGNLADRIGRVRVLQASIVWFSVFTFLSGLATNYPTMMAFRVLQGIGFGGEWAAGAVLMAEIISPRHRGKAVAAVSSGWAVGYGMAALIFTALFALIPAETAWRVLFFIGILPAFLIVYIQRSVTEPEVFLENRATATPGSEASLADIFASDMLPRTAGAWLMCLGVLGGNYTVLTWLPTYLHTERGLSYANTGLFLMVNIAGSFLGYILGGYVSDRVGRINAVRIFAVLGVVSIGSYVLLANSATAILLMGFPLGFAQSAMNAGGGPFLSELFPTRLRATGQGFCYNAGRGVGAALPAMVGVLSANMSLTLAICGAAAIAYALVVIASFLLPETRGVVLTGQT